MTAKTQRPIVLPLSPPASPPSPRAVTVVTSNLLTKPASKPIVKLGSTNKAQMRKKGKRAGHRKPSEGSLNNPPPLDLDDGCCEHDQLYPDRPPSPSHASCSSKCTRFDYTRIALTRENYQHISALLWSLVIMDMRAVIQSGGAFISQTSEDASSQGIELDPNSSIVHALRHRYLHLPPITHTSKSREKNPLGFTTNHASCQLRACAVKRAGMFDVLLEAESRAVPVKIHVQPELIGKIPLKPFNVDLNLHVHTDEMTGSEYICAPELVRAFFPCFYSSVTKLMHSLYTLNHAYGRGSVCPIDERGYDDSESVLPLDTWKHWVGCPQALQSRKPSPNERETRIWLVDGSAEIAFGAECQPDEATIDPEITNGPETVRVKGKGKA